MSKAKPFEAYMYQCWLSTYKYECGRTKPENEDAKFDVLFKGKENVWSDAECALLRTILEHWVETYE